MDYDVKWYAVANGIRLHEKSGKQSVSGWCM